jgi:hypothetical protein
MTVLKATYIYADERGVPRLRKLRREPKRFRMQAARFKGHRLYWKSEPGCVNRWQPEFAPRAIYNLPVVLDALQHHEPVYLLEGERDCDALGSLNKVATTTNWQGAGKFTPEQGEWFTLYGGKSDVHIVMDADDPGHWAGHQRYSLLIGAGVKPKRLRLWRPSSVTHKDVTDVALAGLRPSAFERVSPRAVEERASAYGAERAARYTFAVEG